MAQTPQRCPHCGETARVSSDMWGQYYLCEDCGWGTEGVVQAAARRSGSNVPATAVPVEQANGARGDREHVR
jgi:hypothetical protein